MDIAPGTRGHCLVIPRAHAADLTEISSRTTSPRARSPRRTSRRARSTGSAPTASTCQLVRRGGLPDGLPLPRARDPALRRTTGWCCRGRRRPPTATSCKRPPPRSGPEHSTVPSRLRASRVGCLGMVETELAAVGILIAVISPQRSSLIGRLSSTAFALELGDRRADVVAHQVELVMAGLVGGVHGQLCGRQGDDGPAVAGVDRREFEDVSDERANRVCVLGEDDRVGAGDHAGRATQRPCATPTRSCPAAST